MPSTSAAQAHFMSAIAHGWQPSGRHVPVSVGKDYHEADKRAGKWEHASRQTSDHMNGYREKVHE